MSLEIAILGSLEPRADGAVVRVPAGRQRALLTLLALQAPQPVLADAVAEALWPGSSSHEALRNVQVTVPGALIPAIAAALGVEDDGGPLDAAIARRLHARPTLLVLDNFERLVDAAPAVDALLERTPSTRVLVTSQLPLRVARERLLRLDPLAPDSAAALFHERARAAAADYDASEHAQTVAAICARVDGMPLGVELAAARVSTLAPDELLARLDDSLGVLARGPRDLAERHRSLRAALQWTYDLLEPEEQTLLARLAAFAGPAPLDAVEAVADVAGKRGPVDALEALSGLIDASFLRRTDSREHGVRYAVAQAVRDFAAERLATEGEEQAVRDAHAQHVAAVGGTFRGMGTPDAVQRRVFALDAEFGVALAWTRAHAPALHTSVAAALGLVLIDSARSRQAHEELGLMIERSGIAGATGGWAAVVRAYAAIVLGSRSEAALVDAGLAALRGAGDDALYGRALDLAGVYWMASQEPERALAYTTEAVALARHGPDPVDRFSALNDHGNNLIELGRLDEAEALLREAASLLPQIGTSDLDADGLFDTLAAARGDWARAAPLFLAYAGTRARDLGAKGMNLRHVAIALAQLGADEDALELATAANAISASVGEPPTDPLSARYGSALDEARRRLGPERTARAVERGATLPERDSAARAADMVRAAGLT